MSTTGSWNAIFPTGTGSSGQWLTSTGTGTATWTTSDYYTTYNVDINKRLDQIEARLLILQPAIELHEKYPALKEAYEHYKLIEKLVNSQIEGDNDGTA